MKKGPTKFYWLQSSLLAAAGCLPAKETFRISWDQVCGLYSKHVSKSQQQQANKQTKKSILKCEFCTKRVERVSERANE